MARDFDDRDATRMLSELAKSYEADVKSNGGGLRHGCTFDSYFSVGGDGYKASIAIRNPRSDRPAYFAITRLSEGRKVVDDQIPLAEWSLAAPYFSACVRIAEMGTAARTIGLIDRRAELWADAS